MESAKAKQKIFIISVFIVVLLLVMSIALLFASRARDNTPDNMITNVLYPLVYNEKNLPKYENGELTEAITEKDEDKRKMTISITTADSVTKISKFYLEELEKLGWESPDLPTDNISFYSGRFTKDNETFSLTISNLDARDTQIHIVFEYSVK